MNAREIAAKWFDKIGYGFNPDTPSSDYEPSLSATDATEYDRDMEALHGLSDDPAAVCLEVMGIE